MTKSNADHSAASCKEVYPDADDWSQQSKQHSPYKVLLLGVGDSGKSTLLKQMRILHGDTFDSFERTQGRRALWSNLLAAFKEIINDLDLESLDNLKTSLAVSKLQHQPDWLLDTEKLPEPLIEAMHTLWDEPLFQQARERRNLNGVQGNMSYIYRNVRRLVSPDDLPSDHFILNSRLRTLGITETTLGRGHNKVLVSDTGGERSERKKWHFAFEGVSKVVFVVPLSGYNQPLTEDPSATQMTEALLLFESLLKHENLQKCDLTLVFTKSDLFREKVLSHPIEDYFPEFRAPEYAVDIYQRGMLFFVGKFLALNIEHRSISVHAVDVTDIERIKPCLPGLMAHEIDGPCACIKPLGFSTDTVMGLATF